MMAPDEMSRLQQAAAGDPQRLAELLSRRARGEPLAYLLGHLDFRGHRFLMDRRAYVTDPEASHLVDTVLSEGRSLAAALGRPLQLVEFGIGAATLSLSAKLEQPDWDFCGLDIDADALALAAENARLHGAELELIRSDYFDAWPPTRPAPDLLFGDPPWGSREDLYDDTRDAAYYDAMPPASAYPAGGRTAIHDELIRRLVARAWTSHLVINFGVIPRPLIERSAAPLAAWRLVHPKPGMSVLIGKAV